MFHRLVVGAAIALIIASPIGARAAELEVGQKAPEFTALDQTGKTHHLSDYKGKRVVLAFFPKADTPG